MREQLLTFISSAPFLYYLLGINVLTFFFYGIDKWKAQKQWRRINERTLLLLACIGGSIGAWSGMKCFRHKTQHKKFVWGVPVILLLQIALGIYLFCYL